MNLDPRDHVRIAPASKPQNALNTKKELNMTTRNLFPNIWSPMRDMSRFQRNMDRVFNEFLNESVPSLIRTVDEWPVSVNEFTPLCDVSETDTHYLATFDLPGVKKDEVKIECRDRQLIVSGARQQEKKEEIKGRLSQERFYGTFTRSFTLPVNVNFEQAEASFENGVLQIAIPKAEITLAKQIPIKEGKLLLHKKDIKSEKAA